jgi:GT2 family glycosyltransferase
MYDVTVEISTKNRYEALSLALLSISNQSYKPKKIIIYDDSDNPIDMRKVNIFNNIFKILDLKNISWEVIISPKKGQVFNHQTTLSMAPTDWIWRIDDDNVVEPDTLYKLIQTIFTKSNVGAVASCVLHPNATFHPNATSSKIEDCLFKYASQFCYFKGIKSVDHLYSTFLFNKKAAKHGYCMDLSVVGHREETIFSHEIKRAGYELLVNGEAITWHFQNPTGGIRSFNNPELWAKDQKVFENKLKEWNINLTKFKFIYLNNGLGDHYSFKHILPEIKNKYKDYKLVAAVYYPEAFWDEPDIELMDLNSGQILIHGDIDKYDIYKYGHLNNHNTSVLDIYRKIYL